MLRSHDCHLMSLKAFILFLLKPPTWKYSSFISQGDYLDESLVCALNQLRFDTYVSDTYSFAYLFFFQLKMGQKDQIPASKECH